MANKPFKQQDNSGAIFKNDDPQVAQGPAYKRKPLLAEGTFCLPDYTGSATIDGVEYWVSAWINQSKGKKDIYMGLTFKDKRQAAAAKLGKTLGKEQDSDVPF